MKCFIDKTERLVTTEEDMLIKQEATFGDYQRSF